ncbi:ABC transporter ATP-binding protein [Paenibacillus sp. NPDC058071]|uniref:ABC transporter ATP-binding protein n=1 Tax=Paenibacillus sp. NPDC058071 TaxID=3346326 RepID=UPI0036D951EA
MILAERLVKTYGTGESIVRALKEVDLVIDQGEMVSIVGPSGCGKTTLLQVLSGIEEPDSGIVTINGFSVYEVKDRERSAFRLQHTGFVFQAFHLIPVLSALENVALPLIGLGVSSRKANVQARQALEQVGLGQKLNAFPSELSGGQNQRVAIARAIVTRPSVIWADEPTGALDTDTSHQIVGLLRHINRTMGTTIVVVTHDAAVASECDRIIRMENGRIISGAQRVTL